MGGVGRGVMKVASSGKICVWSRVGASTGW